jgi:hypothetical protein
MISVARKIDIVLQAACFNIDCTPEAVPNGLKSADASCA